jgi:hypothetical protein
MCNVSSEKGLLLNFWLLKQHAGGRNSTEELPYMCEICSRPLFS